MTELTVPELDRPRVVAGAEYLFEGPQGRVSLTELFAGHPRLAVHHPMADHSGPADVVPTADLAAALNDPGLRLVLVSRAPYAKLEQYRRHLGWDLAAYSAVGTTFTEDFPATRHVPGDFWDDECGLSFFRLADDTVLHTGSVAVPRLEFLGLLGPPGGFPPAPDPR
ncbi:hypothetical protein AMES_6776 [Amycolatopsis mediterranei S699]|uniref:Uncharacterized protein n=2 Tax=Amycolatopsis mediterranei TaxID=33910 RepID=A0A0H3DEE5_AMYMU|nr:DUF899 family protein [Amycolatopsis mediterranei]ADJ48602.1 conserved hypothetical protein [Amycolatopsis mediterranei U32]AEK45534.1 hypothetical protein RAM_35305 [Amycolatopsis mediterranei S699]AFO80311.1 hypothetical protein AMES_6776 [Amycolatopsis mediterranei S699]AGT87439.1 hypothetical protein B737_6776 [Amycolatopsis mediterranei RB]KDO11211.1 hypothetical protein DV26_08780 [Amycolatopsis mediterranei]